MVDFADFTSPAPFTASSGVDATCSVAALRRSTQTKAAPLTDAQDDDARRFATLRMALHTPDAHTPVASKPYNLQTSPLPEAEEQPPTQATAAAVAQEAEIRDPAVVCSIALATPLTVKPSATDSKPAKHPTKQFGSLQEELAAAVKARQAAVTHQQHPSPQLKTLPGQNGTTFQHGDGGKKAPPPPPPLPPKALKKTDNVDLQKGSPAPPPPPAPPKGSISAAKKPLLSGASSTPKAALVDKSVQGLRASGASQAAKVRDYRFS